MSIHPLWVVLVLIVVAVPAAAVLLAIALGRSGRDAYRAPVLSPDGRFWWDGRSWQPMPPSSSAATPPASGSGSGKA